jgi:O-antigen/teichoic acid export membrane protein
MKKEVGQLVKHSGIYGLGTILSKSVGFLMIPVYTHYLQPLDYGVLEMLDLTLFFTGIFGTMGITGAFFRFFAAAESEKEKKEVASTAAFTVAAISLLIVIAMQFMAGALSYVAFGTPAYAHLIRIVAFTLLFSNLTEVPLAFIRAQQHTMQFVIIGFFRTFLGASSLILAVAILQKGVLGVVYANLIVSVIVGLALSAFLCVRAGMRISQKKFEEMFIYGAPLILHSLTSFVLVYSDRFFLRHFASLAEVGIYGLGYRFGAVLPILVGGPFSMAWSWQQFELAKEDNAKAVFARIQVYQLVVSTFVGLGISLLARPVLEIMTPAVYWSAAAVVPLIVLSYIVHDMRSVIWTGILVRQATHHLAWISLVVVASNLILNYVLISGYSYMGAAVSTVLSYAISLILGYIVAQRIYFVHYDYLRNLLVLVSAGAIYYVSGLFNFHVAALIVVDTLLAFLFLAISIVFLKAEERTMFWQLGARAIERVKNIRFRQLG